MNQSSIIEALKNKQVSEPCPRCKTKAFSVIGESELLVKRADGGLLLSGTTMSLPIIIVTCDNCGYISQHAAAALSPPQSKAESFLGLGILGGRRV